MCWGRGQDIGNPTSTGDQHEPDADGVKRLAAAALGLSLGMMNGIGRTKFTRMLMMK